MAKKSMLFVCIAVACMATLFNIVYASGEPVLRLNLVSIQTLSNQKQYPVMRIDNPNDFNVTVRYEIYGTDYVKTTVVPAKSTSSNPFYIEFSEIKDGRAITVKLYWRDENNIEQVVVKSTSAIDINNSSSGNSDASNLNSNESSSLSKPSLENPNTGSSGTLVFVMVAAVSLLTIFSLKRIRKFH